MANDYIITRGFQEGVQLTPAQKTSALFAEEPVVLGRALRRLSKPLRIDHATYKHNEHNLLRLEKAGAIKIQRPTMTAQLIEEDKRIEEQLKNLMPNQGAGDTTPTTQESSGAVASAAAEPPAEPPAVIIPPHPPSTEESPQQPEPPAVEPQKEAPAAEEPEEDKQPEVVASQPAEPLAEGTPVPVALPQQTKSKERRKRS